jgi:hypothetical protein
MARIIPTFLCLLIPIFVGAQEPLTNDAVVKLVKAGLSEELIVQMIGTQPGNYKLSADDVLSLKNQGVSDRIIAAMLNKGAGPTPGRPAAEPAPAGYPAEIGVYWKKENDWIEILPEVVNWKTGGVFKSVVTAGVVKGDVNGHLNGKESNNRLTTPLEFLVYTPEGVAITEYQLLKLRENKNNREFRTVTGGVLHAKGGATRDLVSFEAKKVASRTFLINLTSMKPGEYGFLPPGAFVSASSASIGKMYTFSVLE